MAEERSWIDLDLVARQPNVAKVPLRLRKDLRHIRGDDHDVVAIAHPPEPVVEVAEVQVRQHGGEVRPRAETISPQEGVDVPPDSRVQSVHQPLQPFFINRCEVTLNVERQPLTLEPLDMANRRMDAVALPVSVDPLSETRSNQFVDSTLYRPSTLL